MLRARVCCCAHTVRPAVTHSQNRYEEKGEREGGRVRGRACEKEEEGEGGKEGTRE